MDKYQLYFTSYNHERDRLRHYYQQLKSEEIAKVKKSSSINESIQRADYTRRRVVRESQKKAHEFNQKAKEIQLKNLKTQEDRYQEILNQKQQQNQAQSDLENRLSLLSRQQSERIRQHQLLYEGKQKLYVSKLDQFRQLMEDEHRQIMEKLRIKFKMAEEHVKGVREEERNRLRSLSAKYREYKVRATHMLNERVEQLFQEGLGSIERRERQFSQFQEMRVKEQRKIVLRNKKELQRYRKNRRKMNEQKSITPQKRTRKSLHEATEKPDLAEQQVRGENALITEIETSETQEVTRLPFLKLPMAIQADQSLQEATVQVQKLSRIHISPKTMREEREMNYQSLIKFRLQLHKEKQQLELELNKFLQSLSQ